MSGSKRVGEELVERLARFVESLPDDAANSLQASSASTERAARKADVMPTAVTQIAQWLQEVETKIDVAKTEANGGSYSCWFAAEVVRSRLRSILNAINETQGEGTKPNA